MGEAQQVVKSVRSWCRPPGIRGLIGRKHVDWSIFHSGTTIPTQFHDGFLRAIPGSLYVGASANIGLLVEGIRYESLLNYRRVRSTPFLEIRYDSNEALRQLLISRLRLSYDWLEVERQRVDAHATGKRVRTPKDDAEYIDVYETPSPALFRIELVTR